MKMQEQNNKRFLSESIDFNYKMLVNACKFTTLYLLKQFNNLQFLFQDPLERQYRVKLGQQIKCDCHEGNLGHCIHSLYVLIRIYKLPEMHPFIYKKFFTPQDLKQISSLKIANKQTKHNFVSSLKQIQIQIQKTKNAQINRVEQQRRSNVQLSPNKIVKKQKIELKWPTFDKETVCSICYDQIQNQTPIIDCQGCKNYYHTKCLKVWVAQKRKQNNEASSCPMCRRDFEESISSRIIKMDKYYIQYHQSHGIDCSNCGKDILIKIYKCLLCQKYFLCSDCYSKWQHKNHDKFIGKLSKKSEWVVTERSQFNINKLNANLEYVKKFGTKDSEIKQLMGPKYEQFVSSYIKKPTIKQHVINSLMDVEKEVHKTYKKLDFQEKDITCCVCRKKKIVGMRRMLCKHFIDEKCLKFLLENDIKQCPVDKKFFLPGLYDLQLKLQ